MTPELKVACEVVFQEHRSSSYPINWSRDNFRGRLSTGLSEMAKETLVQKNIICFPNPAKKVNTVLNPAVSAAGSYEEAEDIILHKKVIAPALATPAPVIAKQPVHNNSVTAYLSRTVTAPRIVAISGRSEATDTVVHVDKWYLRPVFYYFVWPVCAAIAGGALAFLMGSLYTELFFDLKK